MLAPCHATTGASQQAGKSQEPLQIQSAPPGLPGVQAQSTPPSPVIILPFRGNLTKNVIGMRTTTESLLACTHVFYCARACLAPSFIKISSTIFFHFLPRGFPFMTCSRPEPALGVAMFASPMN